MQKMKLDHCLTPYIKFKSKSIKDFNLRLETIKVLKENIGSKQLDTNFGDDVLNLTPKTKKQKQKYTSGSISTCTAKEIINKMKRPSPEQDKIFAKSFSD